MFNISHSHQITQLADCNVRPLKAEAAELLPNLYNLNQQEMLVDFPKVMNTLDGQQIFAPGSKLTYTQ